MRVSRLWPLAGLIVAAAVLAVVLAAHHGGPHLARHDPYDEAFLKCSEVWVVGKSLPHKWDGYCEQDNGDIFSTDEVRCKGGWSYVQDDNDRYFAKLGGKVRAGPMSSSGQYTDASSRAFLDMATKCDRKG
jgi:hypothetical protein